LAGMLAFSVLTSLMGPRASGPLREAAQYILTPFGDAGMHVAVSFNSRLDELGRRSISQDEVTQLIEENERLQRKASALAVEIRRMLQQRKSEDHLYGPVPYAQWRLVPARVVAVDALPYQPALTVNAGNNQGVGRGALVTKRRLITDRSKSLPELLPAIAELPVPLGETSGAVLVGRIVGTGAHTATLRLVIDNGFRIGARIRRVIDPVSPRTITLTTGEAKETLLTDQNNAPIDVVAAGDGRGRLIVKDVYAYDNVRVGDVLVTSGGEGLLPAEIHIGTVDEVSDDPERKGLFVHLVVSPAADTMTLRDVYIVVPVGALGSGGEG